MLHVKIQWHDQMSTIGLFETIQQLGATGNSTSSNTGYNVNTTSRISPISSLNTLIYNIKCTWGWGGKWRSRQKKEEAILTNSLLYSSFDFWFLLHLLFLFLLLLLFILFYFFFRLPLPSSWLGLVSATPLIIFTWLKLGEGKDEHKKGLNLGMNRGINVFLVVVVCLSVYLFVCFMNTFLHESMQYSSIRQET